MTAGTVTGVPTGTAMVSPPSMTMLMAPQVQGGQSGAAQEPTSETPRAIYNLYYCAEVGFNIQAAIAVHADIFAGTDRSEGLRCTGPEGIMNV